ncbi:DUF2441 domain-containing protein [Acinetobacter sp. RIT698]|uniref:DUF2441 domain-containing protein n=1 Tax=Acinetobacter sp. RIT698 TaxID=2666192 RepID=UPI0012AC9953|nr:DUF2441 domain-containing protein [Acinetobacter sp. RIT698]MRT38762.1 DUF2441 domain-containing protein [Acinetobacter sp. RIT698]
MEKFFTVDRSGAVSSGESFELISDFSLILKCSLDGMLTIEELVSGINQLYPDGISKHGASYLLNDPILCNQTGDSQLLPVSPMIEAIFEQVRRADFPHLPSRMTSMFGWQSLAEAVEFANTNHAGGFNLFEVEVEDQSYFIGDMNLLFIGGQVINTYLLAQKYWSGQRSANPKLEVLIPLPVTIGNNV